LNESTQHQ